MRKLRKKSISKEKRHHLSYHHDDARDLLRETMFSAHNKFLERLAYNFGGEIVNTHTNKNQKVGMSIEDFDKKNKGNEYGNTIDRLDFILVNFSNKDQKTISNCKKLLKFYKKYEWPLKQHDLEYSDSEGSGLIYLPIFPITWADGVDENYKYMEELCKLIAECVDNSNTID